MRNSYLRLMGIFYKNTLISEMEYRVNFVGNLGLSLFWLVWAALSVRVYFYHAETIAGWTYDEMLIVMGLFFTLNGYRQMILEPNLSRMSEHVRLGTLDYILTKPVDSQFLVSLRHIGVYNWGDPLMGLGLVVIALARMNRVPGPVELGLFIVLLLAAMVLLYSLSLILQTTPIWLVNVERLDTIVMGGVHDHVSRPGAARAAGALAGGRGRGPGRHVLCRRLSLLALCPAPLQRSQRLNPGAADMNPERSVPWS